MFKIRLGGITFKCREMDEFDLLGVEMYPPIFIVNADYKKNPIQKIIDEQEENAIDRELEEKKLKEYKRHIVSRCIIKKSRKLKDRSFLNLLENMTFLDQMYLEISIRSIKNACSISRKKAEQIYYLYKGKNYAREYFGDKLSKIEEFSFNGAIHNIGTRAERRQVRAK